MKCLVLLALVGLASCRTVLLGGDNARDVTITYSYTEANGKEIEVEIKADRLDLGLKKVAPATPTLKKTAPAPPLKRAVPTPAATPAPVVQARPVQLKAFPQSRLTISNAKWATSAAVHMPASPFAPPQPLPTVRKPATPVASDPLAAVRRTMAAMDPFPAVRATSASDESDEDSK